MEERSCIVEERAPPRTYHETARGPLLNNVLKQKDFSASCVSGFRATGLFPWNADSIDYTKCLEKRKDTEAQGDPEPEQTPTAKTLSLERFCDIVGEDRVAVFKAMQAQKQVAEVNILYKLWLEFHEQCPANSIPSAEQDTGNKGEAERRCPEPNIASGQAQMETSDAEDDPAALVSTEPEPSTSQQQPASALRDHLQWPEAPRRKGLRTTERLPFVISSKKYQDILEEKARKKAEEEAQKEERKRKREEQRQERGEEKRRKQGERQKAQEERRRIQAEKRAAAEARTARKTTSRQGKTRLTPRIERKK